MNAHHGPAQPLAIVPIEPNTIVPIHISNTRIIPFGPLSGGHFPCLSQMREEQKLLKHKQRLLVQERVQKLLPANQRKAVRDKIREQEAQKQAELQKLAKERKEAKAKKERAKAAGGGAPKRRKKLPAGQVLEEGKREVPTAEIGNESQVRAEPTPPPPPQPPPPHPPQPTLFANLALQHAPTRTNTHQPVTGALHQPQVRICDWCGKRCEGASGIHEHLERCAVRQRTMMQQRQQQAQQQQLLQQRWGVWNDDSGAPAAGPKAAVAKAVSTGGLVVPVPGAAAAAAAAGGAGAGVEVGGEMGAAAPNSDIPPVGPVGQAGLLPPPPPPPLPTAATAAAPKLGRGGKPKKPQKPYKGACCRGTPNCRGGDGKRHGVECQEKTEKLKAEKARLMQLQREAGRPGVGLSVPGPPPGGPPVHPPPPAPPMSAGAKPSIASNMPAVPPPTGIVPPPPTASSAFSSAPPSAATDQKVPPPPQAGPPTTMASITVDHYNAMSEGVKELVMKVRGRRTRQADLQAAVMPGSAAHPTQPGDAKSKEGGGGGGGGSDVGKGSARALAKKPSVSITLDAAQRCVRRHWPMSTM